MNDDLKLLTKRRVADILGVHEQTIMRLVREKKFPQPLRTGAKGSAVRWRTTDVAGWIDQRTGAAACANTSVESEGTHVQ